MIAFRRQEPLNPLRLAWRAVQRGGKKMGVVCQNDVVSLRKKREREMFKLRSTDGPESSVIYSESFSLVT